jgi:hypothetical protein
MDISINTFAVTEITTAASTTLSAITKNNNNFCHLLAILNRACRHDGARPHVETEDLASRNGTVHQDRCNGWRLDNCMSLTN